MRYWVKFLWWNAKDNVSCRAGLVVKSQEGFVGNRGYKSVG